MQFPPNLRRLSLYLCLLLLTQCGGCKKEDPDPKPPVNQVDLLPPATQTGQRTFGCLLNGQAWTPAGNPFGGPQLSSVYRSGRLGISANRTVVVNGMNSFQRIGFAIEGIQTTGTYTLTDSVTRVGTYENFDNGCTLHTSVAQVGTLVITKLDLVGRVAAGRFSFTLSKPGCGQVAITEGRFDCPF